MEDFSNVKKQNNATPFKKNMLQNHQFASL